MTSVIIRVENLTKVYRMGAEEVRALGGVSLAIERGDFVAIMGPSGSGKSTMMHILGCLDTPTSGAYYLDGFEVSALDDRELARIRNRKIGFIFQSFNLLPRTTAMENVQLPMIYGRRGEREERARWALDQVGLSDRRLHFPNQLSGGQQQRVAIARALVNDAPVLMADEPTGNLASLQSEEIMQVFQRLNDDGKTVVMVTHEPDVAAHARRIVRFHDGRIVDDERIKDRVVASVVMQTMRREGASV